MLYTAFLCVLSKVWRVGKLVILMIMRRKRIKLIGRDLKQYRIFFIPFSITGSETKIPSLDILWMSRPNKLLQKANKLIEPFRIFKHAFFCQVISLNPFSFFLLSLHITVTSPTGPATFFFFLTIILMHLRFLRIPSLFSLISLLPVQVGCFFIFLGEMFQTVISLTAGFIASVAVLMVFLCLHLSKAWGSCITGPRNVSHDSTRLPNVRTD